MRSLVFVCLMLLGALLGLLFTASCDPSKPSVPVITGACTRSFRPTLEAWEAVRGRVPETCAYLDTVYAVQLVSEAEIPCEKETNGLIVGCTQPEERTIYLLKGRSASELVDTSVHEWVHALADCVDGDRDTNHLRGELWGDYGVDAIEVQAQAAAVIGGCL